MDGVFVGFDSAWAGNPKKPGAIAAYEMTSGRRPVFHPPRLVSFEEAARFVDSLAVNAPFVLVAIDQPTVVPNHDGCRPVDRVAASLISSLRGGVQPARRGGTGALMFGDGAPIWRFLDSIGGVQDPIQARRALSGRFVMEVFPALALPAIVPAIWSRRRAAKYNPIVRKNYDAADWRMVASGVAAFARDLEADGLAEWLDGHALVPMPRKADQDYLDAAICLAIALAWRVVSSEETLLIGDRMRGYMATLVSDETKTVLVKAAGKRGVPAEAVARTTEVLSVPANMTQLRNIPATNLPLPRVSYQA